MIDGAGRSLKMVPWKSWATAETVATLDRVLTEWRRRYPEAQPILVGNLSAPGGGKLEPHGSHQSGRDVDLSYPQLPDPREELNWREMSADNLDRAMTWKLLLLLVETGAVERIYIDTRLQALLHAWALEHEPVPRRTLSRWLEYPRPPGSSGAIVEHVPGHIDHLHVRFACSPGHTRCKTR
jgi:murein endopeptidase